jgi:hypothetical protein
MGVSRKIPEDDFRDPSTPLIESTAGVYCCQI